MVGKRVNGERAVGEGARKMVGDGVASVGEGEGVVGEGVVGEGVTGEGVVGEGMVGEQIHGRTVIINLLFCYFDE